MSLLRWIQGNNSQASSSKDPLKSQAAGAAASPAPPLEGVSTGAQQAIPDGDGPDAKRFGMENVSGHVRLLPGPKRFLMESNECP